MSNCQTLFDTVKHVKADAAVRQCMEEYQRYLADTKLPHPVDGLKDVSRRAIYVMGTKKEFTKFSQFIASVMEVHPHGDSSIQSAIERLFRTWDVRIPLICCEGNVGSYTEVPGAPRYLEVSSAEFARDLFFNGVHQSTIPMQYTIEYNSVEPKYLIPRLPNALLMGNLTIGLGFKSVVFPLSLENVCILVQKYVEHLKKDPLHYFTGKDCPKQFIPDFPTFCYLRNEKELIDSYREGNFYQRLYTDGVFDITKHSIVIRNIPALLPFSKLHEKLVEVLRNKNHWLTHVLKDFKDTISDKHHGSLKLIFKNNVNPWRILSRIKQLVNFTSCLTPIYSYETDGKIITLTPPNILRYWYDARYQSIVNGLNAEQNELLTSNIAIDAVLHVVDYKDKVIEIIKNATTTDAAVVDLAQQFNITKNQATIITKTALGRLTKSSKEELYKEKESIIQSLTDNTSKFSKIPEIIYDDAAYFRKKYSKPRRTLIPKYMGYVHIGDCGLYQYTSEDELFSILKEFNGSRISIHQYKHPDRIKAVVNGRKIEEYTLFSVPRQLTGTAILEKIPDDSRLFTLVHIDGTVSYLNGFRYPKSITGDMQIEYVYENFVGLFRNGSIEMANIQDHSLRKSLTKGKRSDLVYAIPYGEDGSESVVMYMSTSPSYINNIFITRLYKSKGKGFNRLLTTPPYTYVVLDVRDITDTGVIVHIPNECTNLTADHIYISDISRLMVSDTVSINLRMGSYNTTDGEKQKPIRHPDSNSLILI